MRVGQGDHELDLVFAQRGPTFHATYAFKAENVAIKEHCLFHIAHGQHGANVFQVGLCEKESIQK